MPRPNVRTIFLQTKEPGRTASFANVSASIRWAPQRTIKRATTLLPLAMPPVKPTLITVSPDFPLTVLRRYARLRLRCHLCFSTRLNHPFRLFPTHGFFPSRQHDEALTTLLQGIEIRIGKEMHGQQVPSLMLPPLLPANATNSDSRAESE